MERESTCEVIVLPARTTPTSSVVADFAVADTTAPTSPTNKSSAYTLAAALCVRGAGKGTKLSLLVMALTISCQTDRWQAQL